MKASEMIAAALASMESLSQFVRDDGANYFADAKNTLNVALTTSQAEEATPPAAPLDGAAVLAAVQAVGAQVADVSTKVDALKPATA